VTLNPGATTRGMHESLVTYSGNTMPEVTSCSHEEVAAAMAESYYVATGKPQATLVHNIVGLQREQGDLRSLAGGSRLSCSSTSRQRTRRVVDLPQSSESQTS